MSTIAIRSQTDASQALNKSSSNSLPPRGFTLIELMIVVAIVAILAAVALPIYQDYVARSQVSEAMATAGALKTALSEFYQANGNIWPADNQYADTVGGRYSAGVSHVGGVMTATMRGAAPVNPRVHNYQFTVTAIDAAGNALTPPAQIVNWKCAPVAPSSPKYLPAGCQ